MKKDLREKYSQFDANQIKDELVKAGKELFQIRMDIAGGKTKNTKAGLVKRKEIAYLKTLLREKIK